MRSIVAATDLSALARPAAERAAHLARSAGAALTLVHALDLAALDDLRRWLGDGEPCDTLQRDAHARVQALASDLAGRHAVTVDAAVATGHAVHVIGDCAERVGADLVVTGARSAGWFRAVLIGSTAERVSRRLARPVLTVRQRPFGPYRRVLVPVDFSPWSTPAIEAARRLAPDAELVLMHALEMAYEGKMRFAGVADDVVARYRSAARLEARDQLHALAGAAGLPADAVAFATPDGADPWMLIVHEEQERDCDLVVVGKQGRNALEDLLMGSTTRMVLSECSADVLVCGRG
jgi:nucleotide-binding universal stress UspA family protein